MYAIDKFTKLTRALTFADVVDPVEPLGAVARVRAGLVRAARVAAARVVFLALVPVEGTVAARPADRARLAASRRVTRRRQRITLAQVLTVLAPVADRAG